MSLHRRASLCLNFYMMRKFYVLKIEKISLEERLKKFPPDFEFNLDYGYWLLGEIIRETAYRIELTEEERWIPLCSQLLKYHPYNYRNHLRYLGENFPGMGGILFRKDYQEGKCFAYKLSPFYGGEPVEAYRVRDKKLLKFFTGAGAETNNAFKKKYLFLAKYFDPERLRIELEPALWENRLRYDGDLNYAKHLLNAIQAVNIANGRFHLKLTDKSDGRIHTEITRLPKTMRKYLRFDGQPLGEVDISASVPTFLFFILKNGIGGRGRDLLGEIANSERNYFCHYMFIKTSVPVDNAEISSFGQRLFSGQFYDSFIEEMLKIHLVDESLEEGEYFNKHVKEMFNREFDGDLADLRAVMKKNILSMFNARPGYYSNEEYVFGKKYPTILNWIREFKKEDHRYFSHLTLQTESYFMLNIVARKLNRRYRGKIPLLTLHDCIITTEEHLDLLEDFMKEKLTEALGFTPMMKKKIYK